MAQVRLRMAQDGSKMAQKCLQDGFPAVQDGPKTAQDGSKWSQDGFHVVQDGPKTAQDGSKWSQDGLHVVQDSPSWVQDSLPAVQNGPKMAQTGSKMAPKIALPLLFIGNNFVLVASFYSDNLIRRQTKCQQSAVGMLECSLLSILGISYAHWHSQDAREQAHDATSFSVVFLQPFETPFFQLLRIMHVSTTQRPVCCNNPQNLLAIGFGICKSVV